MKSEKKGLTGGLVVAFAAMMLVPFGYRVWIHFNPPAPRQAFSLTEYLNQAADANVPRLLVKPLSMWSEAEKRHVPEIAVWLEAKSKTILPWEWTDEARRKVPEGYFKSWDDIWDELEDRIEDVSEDVSWTSFKKKWSGKLGQLMNWTNGTLSAESELAKRSAQLDTLKLEVVRCRGLLADIKAADPPRREELYLAFVPTAKACLITCLRTLPTLRPAASD